jgi:hypothetical protein
MAYLELRVFLFLHTCVLAPLEPNLTAVAWRATKIWRSDAKVHWNFSVAHKKLQSFTMAHMEFPLYSLHAKKINGILI